MSIDARPAWVALADGGPVAGLLSGRDPRILRTTADPAVYADLLGALRPRIAILASPPAGHDDIELTLRERRRRPSMRVILLSRPDAIDDRLDALRAGVDEAWPTTIDPAELEARIAILEERARTRHDTVLAVTDDATIDLVAHEVRRADDLVHLRPKEFQLLAMLAAPAGRTRGGSCSTGSGVTTMRATRGPSTSTFAGCAASSSRGPRPPSTS